MKSENDIKKELVSFSDTEKQTFRFVEMELKIIQESNSLSEDNVKKLTNIITQLNSLKESYFWRLLRAAKQNHMID
jgi:hypothetical protein